MSFGFSIGDFITISQLGWKVYRICKDSAADFQNISGEVLSLHVILKETEDLINENGGYLSPQSEARLMDIGNGCYGVFKDLEALLAKYESMGTQSRRTWNRLKWGLEDINAIRDRLVSNTSMLASFSAVLANVSQARLEKKLDQFMAEVRSGQRGARSVLSCRTVDTMAHDEKELWRELRRDLRDAGISKELLAQKKEFILDWFKREIAPADDEYDEMFVPPRSTARRRSEGSERFVPPVLLRPDSPGPVGGHRTAFEPTALHEDWRFGYEAVGRRGYAGQYSNTDRLSPARTGEFDEDPRAWLSAGHISPAGSDRSVGSNKSVRFSSRVQVREFADT